MIYLVSVDPITEKETHTEWSDYTSLEEAKKEYAEMRKISVESGEQPLDGYVYESNKPLYGNVATKLNVSDFDKYSKSWAKNNIISSDI